MIVGRRLRRNHQQDDNSDAAADDRGPLHLGDGAPDEGRAVEQQVQLHGRRQLLTQGGQPGLDEVRHLHCVGARLLADRHDEPGDAVDPGARETLLHPVVHLGDILEIHRRGAVVAQDDVPDIVYPLEFAQGPHHEIGAPAFQVPADLGDVFGAQYLDDALQGNTRRGQPGTVDQYLNLAFVAPQILTAATPAIC